MANKSAREGLMEFLRSAGYAGSERDGALEEARRVVREGGRAGAGELRIRLEGSRAGDEGLEADPAGSSGQAGQALEQVARQMEALVAAWRKAERPARPAGTSQGTGASSQSGGSTLAGYVSPSLGNWEKSMPLVAGLKRLFGGGGPEAASATLVRYEMPASLNFEAGVTDPQSAGIGDVDYEAGGRARMINRAAPTIAPQITVNVNAMDSRSFLDHRDEIARAVRQAMLDAHPLNDVISEI